MEDNISFSPTNELPETLALTGTMRALTNNLIEGVSVGYEKKLEINGVGYRAQVEGEELVLQLGYSHDVKFPIPEGIKITCSDQTHINIFEKVYFLIDIHSKT